METNMKDHGKMIKKKGLDASLGEMETNMKEIG